MANMIKITFLGDLMCQTAQVRAIRNSKSSYDDVFSDVKSFWQDSDYVVANLETPVTGDNRRLVFEDLRFNAPASFLLAIKNAGIKMVTTANNHILDRDHRGLDATLNQIAIAGLETTGAYRTQAESNNIFVKEIGGIKFAFVACTYNTNAGRKSDVLPEDLLWKVDYVHHPTPYTGTFPFEVKRFLKELLPYPLKQHLKNAAAQRRSRWTSPQNDSFPVADFEDPINRELLDNVCLKIRRAKEQADIVIALPHIGGQYNSDPGPWQLLVTDALVAAGADLVITNHAHTPLKAELRKNAFCVHSLGNFCFTPRDGFYNDSCQADYSIAVNCWFDEKSRKLARKSFGIFKSVVRDDGVSVVRTIDARDMPDVDIICRRVTGRAKTFNISKEYEL